MKLVVVGGGITGLAAAHRAVEVARERQTPLELTLIEARERLGGTIVSERVDDLPGFTSRPMQRADAEAKFQRNAGAMLRAGQLQRISDAVWNLERSPSVAPLIDSLVVAA